MVARASSEVHDRHESVPDESVPDESVAGEHVAGFAAFTKLAGFTPLAALATGTAADRFGTRNGSVRQRGNFGMAVAR